MLAVAWPARGQDVIRNARAVDETVAVPRPAVNFASLVGHGSTSTTSRGLVTVSELSGST